MIPLFNLISFSSGRFVAHVRGKQAAARFERRLGCIFDAADERQGESKMSPHQGYLPGRRIRSSRLLCVENGKNCLYGPVSVTMKSFRYRTLTR